MTYTETSRNCHHCNLPMLSSTQAFRVWCVRCSNSTGGRCAFCHGDVLEEARCWDIERLLDLALTGAVMGQPGSCGNCHTKMGVVSLTEAKAVLICPRCGRQLTISWTWSKKRERGNPPIDPDGPLPTF